MQRDRLNAHQRVDLLRVGADLAGEIQQAGISRLAFGFRKGEMGRFRADAARAEPDARGQGALETRLRFGQRVGIAVARADVAAHDRQGKPGERIADIAKRLAGHVLFGGAGNALVKANCVASNPAPRMAAASARGSMRPKSWPRMPMIAEFPPAYDTSVYARRGTFMSYNNRNDRQRADLNFFFVRRREATFEAAQ